MRWPFLVSAFCFQTHRPLPHRGHRTGLVQVEEIIIITTTPGIGWGRWRHHRVFLRDVNGRIAILRPSPTGAYQLKWRDEYDLSIWLLIYFLLHLTPPFTSPAVSFRLRCTCPSAGCQSMCLPCAQTGRRWQ